MSAPDLSAAGIKQMLSKPQLVAVYPGSGRLIFIGDHHADFYRRQGCEVRAATENDYRAIEGDAEAWAASMAAEKRKD